MKTRLSQTERGQAIVMVTLALIAMCGVLGLAVDLGWSYFVHKSAQSSADAAALAAAEQAILRAGPAASYPSCPNGLFCGTGYSCAASISTPSTNADNGCIYARGSSNGSGWYGFVDGSNDGRTQMAKIDANIGNPPNIPIRTAYWVTARVSETVPQLFSAVQGNLTGVVAARATAAIVEVPLNGSIWGLNRLGDVNPISSIGGNQNKVPDGADLWVGGSGSIHVPNDIYLASSANGTNGVYAGSTGGNGSVVSGGNYYQQGGATSGSGWSPSTQPLPDGSSFMDPMKGKISPPPVTAGSPPAACAIDLNSVPKKGLNNVVLGPGVYYATRGGVPVAETIPFGNNVTFGSGGSCLTGSTSQSGFGNYVIFGGLSNAGDSWAFDPGRFVLAGVPQPSQGSAGAILNFGNGAKINDRSQLGVQNTDAGEIFILTDYNYQGLSQVIPSALANNPSVLQSFQQGYTWIQGGQSAVTNLHGLNVDNSLVQAASLNNYGPTLFWQDRRNSTVKYNPETAGAPNSSTDGHIYTPCGGDWASPCPNPPDPVNNGVDTAITSPVFNIQGAPNQDLYGLLYQPRGAMFYVQGGGQTLSGHLQVVTGSIYLQGNASIQSLGLANPLTRIIASLVE